MTLALPLVRFGSTHLCPSCGLVNVPDEREFCYGCSKAPTPRVVPESRLDHVRKHLRPQDRLYLDWLLLPLTFDEIAVQLGPGWTRRQVERAWYAIRLQLGLTGSLERLALLRMVARLDPCFCQNA